MEEHIEPSYRKFYSNRAWQKSHAGRSEGSSAVEWLTWRDNPNEGDIPYAVPKLSCFVFRILRVLSISFPRLSFVFADPLDLGRGGVFFPRYGN
jgi:hypothetical protein